MTLKVWTGLLAGLLFVALIAILVLYDFASRPLYGEADRDLIERTRQLQTAFSRGRPPTSFPIVMHLSDRVCVELRTRVPRGAGTYTACYDRAGAVLEEREIGPD